MQEFIFCCKPQVLHCANSLALVVCYFLLQFCIIKDYYHKSLCISTEISILLQLPGLGSNSVNTSQCHAFSLSWAMGKLLCYMFLLDLANFAARVGVGTHLKTSNKWALWEVHLLMRLIIWLGEFVCTEVNRRSYNRVQMHAEAVFEWDVKT